MAFWIQSILNFWGNITTIIYRNKAKWTKTSTIILPQSEMYANSWIRSKWHIHELLTELNSRAYSTERMNRITWYVLFLCKSLIGLDSTFTYIIWYVCSVQFIINKRKGLMSEKVYNFEPFKDYNNWGNIFFESLNDWHDCQSIMSKCYYTDHKICLLWVNTEEELECFRTNSL